MSKLPPMLEKIKNDYFDDDPYKHSSNKNPSYHTFFQGYSEEKKAGKKGGWRVERTYTADYLAFTDDKKEWLFFKAAYLILYGAGLILTVLALMQDSVCNQAVYVIIPEVCELLILLVMFVWIVNYITAPMKMTLGTYETGPSRVKLCGLLSGILAVICVLMMVLCLILSRGKIDRTGVEALLTQSGAAVSLLLLFILEKTKHYREIENEKTVPYNANEIW